MNTKTNGTTKAKSSKSEVADLNDFHALLVTLPNKGSANGAARYVDRGDLTKLLKSLQADRPVLKTLLNDITRGNSIDAKKRTKYHGFLRRLATRVDTVFSK